MISNKKRRGREARGRRDSHLMAWFHQLSFEEESGNVRIVLHTLSFLGVTELVEKKQVCKRWQHLCTQAIDNKCPSPQNFKTNFELRKAVGDYCGDYPSWIPDPDKIEKIAIVYGYPINKWRVQLLKDFSWVFANRSRFNEDISSWDLSNAETMVRMFSFARAFNKPLPWNTSKVTKMNFLFDHASAFNQPLPWNTSYVKIMEFLFREAISFNQRLESWDMSSVTTIQSMFDFASSYNQSMDSWNTSKIVNMKRAFAYATSFNKSLRTWRFHFAVDTRGILFGARSYEQVLPDVLAAGEAFSDDEDEANIVDY